MRLEVELTIFWRSSEDFYLIEIPLPHSGFGEGFEIHNLCGVESHKLRCESVQCERVEACQSEPCIDGRSTGRAVAFHSYEAVDDAEVGINFLCEMEHIVVNEGLSGEIVVGVNEMLIVCFVIVKW